MIAYPEAVSDVAKSFVGESIYQFSDLEQAVLRHFFTNSDRRVFFVHTLPATVVSTLLAMYSRMKNSRGLRGVFVDQFLPEFLATELRETEEKFGGDGAEFLKAHGVTSLQEFFNSSREAYVAFKEFQNAFSVDAEYIARFAASQKVKRFLGTYLDAFGHNSIARTGTAHVCAEQISLLAAKSFEWGRPGSGYIEPSTRYVDMSEKGRYPVESELEAFGANPAHVCEVVGEGFRLYRQFGGEEMQGPFPGFLRDRYADIPANLAAGVFGETCDVLGNFLPACALTSVGCAVSGEALPELVKHLRLDRTPENLALADEIVREAEKLGFDRFLRHTDISLWKEASWGYLDLGSELWQSARGKKSGAAFNFESNLPPRTYVEQSLFRSFRSQESFRDCGTWEEVIERLAETPRGEFDKLPNHFEGISGKFGGVMSFRGWRDFHRMSFCAHYRTFLSPMLGFYEYDKPSLPELNEAFRRIHRMNLGLYQELTARGVPSEVRQYPMALGNLVGFMMVANFAQLEFCIWQRTKWSVNHEVRKVFRDMELRLREAYPWWKRLSELAKPSPRADMTPAYVFARGKIPVPLEK
jgi:thymidylate synthase ThyX